MSIENTKPKPIKPIPRNSSTRQAHAHHRIMIRKVLLAALATSTCSGFTAPASSTLNARAPITGLAAFDNNDFEAVESFDPLNLSSDESSSSDSNGRAAAIAAAAMMVSPLSASAAGPDWGIFEGRTGSLLHPAMMGGMLLFSASTALLGFQWRRQRTMGDEIKALKNTLPNLNGAKTVSEALAAAQGAEEVDAGYVATLRAALPIDAELAELAKERKELASAAPKDKHFNQGSLLLFLGTAFAIEVRFFAF